MRKDRLDALLFNRRICDSREQGKRLVLDGELYFRLLISECSTHVSHTSTIINPIYRLPASEGTFPGALFLKRNARGVFEKPNHNRWLAERLEMNQIRALSCLLGAFQQDIENEQRLKKLEEMSL